MRSIVSGDSHLVPRNNVPNFSSGLAKSLIVVSVVRYSVPGRFVSCPGTDFTSFFHHRKHQGKMCWKT